MSLKTTSFRELDLCILILKNQLKPQPKNMNKSMVLIDRYLVDTDKADLVDLVVVVAIGHETETVHLVVVMVTPGDNTLTSLDSTTETGEAITIGICTTCRT